MMGHISWNALLPWNTHMLSKVQPQTFKCISESTRKYQGSQKSSVPRTRLEVWGGGMFSYRGAGKEASSMIYPNAENSSVICRHKKIPHPADPGSYSNSYMVWYVSAIIKNIFEVYIDIPIWTG